MNFAGPEFRWGNWLQRRIAEVLVFLTASLAMWMLFDSFARVASLFPIVTALLLVYGGVFLYLPLSAGLWFVLKGDGRERRQRLADSIFFIAHSYISMSIMHNGLLGVEREIDLRATSTTPWLAVAGLHVCLIIVSLVHAGRRGP